MQWECFSWRNPSTRISGERTSRLGIQLSTYLSQCSAWHALFRRLSSTDSLGAKRAEYTRASTVACKVVQRKTESDPGRHRLFVPCEHPTHMHIWIAIQRLDRARAAQNQRSLSEKSLEFVATIAGASRIPMNARKIIRSCIMS